MNVWHWVGWGGIVLIAWVLIACFIAWYWYRLNREKVVKLIPTSVLTALAEEGGKRATFELGDVDRTPPSYALVATMEWSGGPPNNLREQIESILPSIYTMVESMKGTQIVAVTIKLPLWVPEVPNGNTQ